MKKSRIISFCLILILLTSRGFLFAQVFQKHSNSLEFIENKKPMGKEHPL